MFQPNKLLKWLFPATYMMRGEESLFFTFDDGPCPDTTPRLLDLLDRAGIKAIFFVVGRNAALYPELMDEIVTRGHLIGNHTMNHIDGFRVRVANYIGDVRQCQQEIDKHYHGRERYFRPPYGHITWLKLFRLRAMGYRVVQWDVIANDWVANRTADDVVDTIRRYGRPGSIVVLHDSIKAAPRCIPAMERIAEECRN